MLEVRGLCAGYPGKTVLRDVSLTAPKGQVTVILGPNGCGKSTLLKALCGILPPERGQVRLEGEDLMALPPKRLAQRVAYLSQSRRVPDITVERLVLHGRFPYLGYPRCYRPEDRAAARDAMERMGICDLGDTLLEELSGGQRQKAYIAMVLAQDTPVVLLDEPTTYLDIAHQLRLMQQARALADQGKTVVMVIHDLVHALQTADRLVVMEEGRVVTEGPPEELRAAGVPDRVFGVRVVRVETDGGARYYCE